MNELKKDSSYPPDNMSRLKRQMTIRHLPFFLPPLCSTAVNGCTAGKVPTEYTDYSGGFRAEEIFPYLRIVNQ